MKLLGAVMGFDMATADDLESKMDTDTPPTASAKKETDNSKPTTTTTTTTSSKPAEQNPVRSSHGKEISSIHFQAEAAKEKGNEAYKKKEFQTALDHYNKATELDPKNMTYYTNRAGLFIFSFILSLISLIL